MDLVRTEQEQALRASAVRETVAVPEEYLFFFIS